MKVPAFILRIRLGLGELTRSAACLAALFLSGPALSQVVCDHPTITPELPQVPQDASGNPCQLIYGLVPPSTAFPFYRWGRLDGSGGIDSAFLEPIVEHDKLSTCWYELVRPVPEGYSPVKLNLGGQHDQITTQIRLPNGFGLKFNPLNSPSIGDFLPASPTIGQSALALIPPGSRELPTGWQGANRPVLEGVADMVTGLPLVQVTDLQLPLGGGMFNLTRTRSAYHVLNKVSAGASSRGAGGIYQPAQSGRKWDWLGQGWMASESPLLIIDSKLPDIVGPYATTSWLVLDAHHSIPFQMVDLAAGPEGPRVGYEAPPRFRARMTHNGVWGEVDDPAYQPETCHTIAGWITPPTQYDIWLYDGEVKYTFVAIREDVPPNLWDGRYRDGVTPSPTEPEDLIPTSYHERPLYPDGGGWFQYEHQTNPGFGIPHYGICVKIEDRFQNKVEFNYCNITRETLNNTETDCAECQQLCLRKGQISSIRLSSQGEVQWTLVYANRLFEGDRFDIQPELWPPGSTNDDTPVVRGTSVIDRIYVYAGDLLDLKPGLQDVCMTIPAGDDPYGTDPAPIDPRAAWNAAHPDSGSQLPDNWVHQIQYFYPSTTWSSDEDHSELHKSPVLLYTQLQSRQQGSGGQGIVGSEKSRYTFFRYGSSSWTNAWSSAQVWLERVYSSDDYERMLAWAAQNINATGSEATDKIELATFLRSTPREFAMAGHSSGTPREGSPSLSTKALGWLHDMASVRMGRLGDISSSGEWPTYPTSTSPSAEIVTSSRGYLNMVATSSLVADTTGDLVNSLSIQTGSGQVRHYRIHHLFALPPVSPGLELIPVSGQFHLGGINSLPTSGFMSALGASRSIFFHPYRWFTTPYDLYDEWREIGSSEEDPWLTAPDLSRPRWIRVVDEFASRKDLDATAPYSDDDNAIKPGQLSRRVIAMNASGYVLTDKTWEFRGEQVAVSGGGLGETFEYQKVATVLGTSLPTDAPDFVKNEALLVRHRSVGWSATDPADQATKGMVHEYEYDYATGVDDDIPWRARIRMIAEAVRNGTAGDKLYTRRLFYDADNPLDLIAEVQPLTSVAAATRPDTIPSYPTDATQAPSFRIERWIKTREEPTGSTETPPRTEWPVKFVIHVSPPHRINPVATDWYYPVEMQAYDTETGLIPWSGAAFVKSPLSPASSSNDSYESVILSYTKYDDWGRPSFKVDDAMPGETATSAVDSSISVVVPATGLPDGWTRIHLGTAPLKQVTYTAYDSYGPTDIYMHNGRRWARRSVILYAVPASSSDPAYREEPDDPEDLDDEPSWGTWTLRATESAPVRRDFVFENLEKVVGVDSSVSWVARSPGKVLDYAQAAAPEEIFRPMGMMLNDLMNQACGISDMGDRNSRSLIRRPGRPLNPIRTRQVFYVQEGVEDAVIDCTGCGSSAPNFLTAPEQANQPHFRQIADVQYRPDQYGRLTDASLFERNADGIMAPIGMKQVNDLGEVYREREMDGSITRVVKNSLGQPTRRYVGTRDDDWLTITGENGELEFSSEDESINNLVLVERTEYGNGTNDAWLPTIVRKYTTNVDFADDWHLKPYAAPPATDDRGQVTRISYDWRMRPVRLDLFAQGDPATATRLTTSLKFLDHAGRDRLEVTYGPGTLPSLGTSRDPSLRSPSASPEIPSAADFIVSGELIPISIVEKVYGPDGEVNEARKYDVAWSGGGGQPPCQVEYKFTGFADATIYEQGPGDAIQLTRIDPITRPMSRALIVPAAGSGGPSYLHEVERTDFAYDLDSNVIRIDQWERVKEATTAADVLGTTNAVFSSEVRWYDVQKRLVATANLGTGNTSFVSNGTGPSTPGWYSATGRPAINPATQAVSSRGGAPVDLPLTINRYNRKGQLEFTAIQQDVVSAQATYTFTRKTYTGFGQIAQVIENPFAASSAQRISTYSYNFGKLSRVDAGWYKGTTSIPQQTEVRFGANEAMGWGADVIDLGMDSSSSRLASRSGSLPRSMHLANATTGASSSTPSVTLRYDFLGRLSERIDARGCVLRYTHDELDRLVSIEAGRYEGDWPEVSFTPKQPDSMRLGTLDRPIDRIGFIQFVYADDLRSVDAYAYDAVEGNLVTHTRMEYDSRGNLVKDWQGIGAEITSSTPKVEYAWNVEFANVGEGRAGQTRLSTMTYPAQNMSAAFARVVTLGYGSTGSNDDLLSRIGSISSTPTVGGDPSSIAAFTYVGAARRAQTDIAGGAIVADLGLLTDSSINGSIGLQGVDRFGRLADLHYRQGSPGASATLTRLQYTYDKAGNRLSAVRTPRTGASTGTQHQSNTYDLFNRLVSSGFANESSAVIETNSWLFDQLNNWSTLTRTVGTTTQNTVFTPDARNQYSQVQVGSGGSSITTPLYDLNGNLIFDGQYAYQYDAWNRLLQVNRATNSGTTASTLVVGRMVKHFTYDAFGRQVRVQSPFPDADTIDGGLRVERLYYDGVRRIQEVVTDPLMTMSMALAEGSPELQSAAMDVQDAADEPIDGSTLPASMEQLAGDLGDVPTTTTYLAREYVWGPGDWGVDDLLAQFDRNRRASWPLQDAGSDAIALCDLGGTSGTGRVTWQATYDAYGRVISAEALATHAPLHVGHKGLFFERLDAGVQDGLGNDIERLVAGAVTLGSNRNRTLHTSWGRYLQTDPHGSGLVVAKCGAFHGESSDFGLSEFDLMDRFADGPNIVEYLGSNTLTAQDPLGLQFLPGTPGFKWGGTIRGTIRGSIATQGWAYLGQTFGNAFYTAMDLASRSHPVSESIDVWLATQWSMTKRAVMSASLGAVPFGLGTMGSGAWKLGGGNWKNALFDIGRGAITFALQGYLTGSGLRGTMARMPGAIGFMNAMSFMVGAWSGMIEHYAYEVYSLAGVRGAGNLLNCYAD